MSLNLTSLFSPFRLGKLELPNRVVMAPMTRLFCPDGIPGPEVATYYRRRAEGGVGLIVTEGAWIPHPAASNDENAPCFYGEEALAGWRHVVSEVHAAGGKIMPQLWHTGLTKRAVVENLYGVVEEDFSKKVSPSGYVGIGEKVAEPMTEAQIEEVIDAYATAAEMAEALGFDGVEIHGAHGYMVDQFFWHETNKRTDRWGGATHAERARFGVEMIRACRRRVSPGFPIVLRISQWKMQDYNARLASTPDELAGLLQPLADAGVDIFHASQRRFWVPEFDGSDLNLAGWAKKVTGKPAITVGSIGLGQEMMETKVNYSAVPATLAHMDTLLHMLDRGDFDLVAIGRALLADAHWANKLQSHAFTELQPYSAEVLAALL